MSAVVKQLKIFKFKIFIIYATLMGGAMGMLCPAGCFEPLKAVLYGVPFGFFMAMFFSEEVSGKKASSEQISSDQDLVLNTSFFPIYLNTFGIFMFSSLMYVLSLSVSDFHTEIAVATAASLVLIQLAFIMSYPAQIVIGQRMIVVRKNWLGFHIDKTYDLQKSKKIKLGWFGCVKVTFPKFKSFVIPKSKHWWFSNLPEFEALDINKKHSSAFKIIRWFEHKKKNSADIDVKAEVTRLKKIPRRKPSLSFIAFSAFLGLVILAAPIFISSQISVLRIEHTKNKNNVFYRDVQNAFWFFDNPARKMFETEWKTACDQRLDFNCRLLSYLRFLDGDKVDALSWVKKSCSHRDPYSCLNILINEESSEMDIKLAEFQISDICEKEEHSGQQYCKCVVEGKVLNSKLCQKLR